MDIFQLDEKGCLFISPDIDDWSLVEERDICAIIDMDGDLDIGVPRCRTSISTSTFPSTTS